MIAASARRSTTLARTGLAYEPALRVYEKKVQQAAGWAGRFRLDIDDSAPRHMIPPDAVRTMMREMAAGNRPWKRLSKRIAQSQAAECEDRRRLVMRPKSALLRAAVGLFRLDRFRTLNPSARNSSLCASDHGIGKALKMDASNVARPGPRHRVAAESAKRARRVVAEGGFVEPGGNLLAAGSVVRQVRVSYDVNSVLSDAAVRIVDAGRDGKRRAALQSDDAVRLPVRQGSSAAENWRASGSS